MKRQWLNYHHLFYFKVIATEGGLAKAAKKLRLGQPTLSTQLKQFENILGYKLFERKQRSLLITEQGKLVLNYANEIFKMGDEMIDALNDQYSLPQTQIQIGICDAIPKHIVLKIYEFAIKNFDAFVSINEGHTDELLRDLRAHQLDLVISNYPPAVGQKRSLYAKKIAKMPVVICGTKKQLKLKRSFPQSLNNQQIIMPTLQSRLRHDLEHFFKIHKINLNRMAEVQDTSLLKIMGTHGYGLIPIAKQAIEELVSKSDLYILGTIPDVFEELWLIAADRKIQNPIAAKIMNSFELH